MNGRAAGREQSGIAAFTLRSLLVAARSQQRPDRRFGRCGACEGDCGQSLADNGLLRAPRCAARRPSPAQTFTIGWLWRLFRRARAAMVVARLHER